MNKTLKERCEQFYNIVCEYYYFNKYYLTEPAKDALHNAADCMALISGKRDYLTHNFSGCDSHLPYITQLASNMYFTDQLKEAFRTAQEALIEVFSHTSITQIISPWNNISE